MFATRTSFVLVLALAVARAQSPAPAAPVQAPTALSGTAAPDSPKAPTPPADTTYAKEPYVFELLQQKFRFEADGRYQRDLTFRVRIQSESAVHDLGLLVQQFASAFESLDVVYARVRKPDGTIIETPPSDVQELDSAVSREAPMYTDEREKHVAIKSLSVGDVLEVSFHWNVHDAMAPITFGWIAITREPAFAERDDRDRRPARATGKIALHRSKANHS
jgi:hypothetical protein